MRPDLAAGRWLTALPAVRRRPLISLHVLAHSLSRSASPGETSNVLTGRLRMIPPGLGVRSSCFWNLWLGR